MAPCPRGTYAAYQIARTHPGRWSYLIVNESDVALDKRQLDAARVRAVALIAGEIGSSSPASGAPPNASPSKDSAPVMKKAGHHYSADSDRIMREAIAFVLETPDGGR